MLGRVGVLLVYKEPRELLALLPALTFYLQIREK
jgi:hypothetical protein